MLLIIQWEVCILSIFHVIQWEFEAWEASEGGRTDGRKEIHPCVLQDIGPLGPLPKKVAISFRPPKRNSYVFINDLLPHLKRCQYLNYSLNNYITLLRNEFINL